VLANYTIWPKFNVVAQIKILMCFPKPAPPLCGLAAPHFDRMADLPSVYANPSILIRSAVAYPQLVLPIGTEVGPNHGSWPFREALKLKIAVVIVKKNVCCQKRAKEISETFSNHRLGLAYSMDAATIHLTSTLRVPDDILAGVLTRVILTFARATEIALKSLHAYYSSAS
jgi:hypothetical protein